MSRLPPIEIAGRPCALPLSEPTAAVLLFALLGSGEADIRARGPDVPSATRAELAEALVLDPSLALWTAIHHARSANADSKAPSIMDLALFLGRHVADVVRGEQREAVENPAAEQSANRNDAAGPKPSRRVQKPHTLTDPRQALAKLAAASVLEAQRMTAASRSMTDPRYLSALLQGAGDWLAQAGMDATSIEALPGWLGRSLCGAKAAPAVARKITRKPRGKSTGRARRAASTVQQRAQAQAAGDRWLVPAAVASRQFATLAARLLRLVDLETHFAERLLEEKLHALGEFAAGAGHEINNPLAVISGRAQLFLQQEADPQRRRELAVINTQARRVHEMIADLMLFARPPQPRPAPCDMESLVGALIAELAPRAAEHNVALRFEVVGTPLPTISADATQVQVALRAVIENALDAAPDGGAVEVKVALHDPQMREDKPESATDATSLAVERVATNRLRISGRALAITVRDNGPGIDAAARRNLFDPFYSGRAAGRGVGMGLSKCWRIVTTHGGRVEIENRPSGGACVTILLPVQDEASTAPGGAF